jgi:uncharacterized RDD family membrane protein YckC
MLTHEKRIIASIIDIGVVFIVSIILNIIIPNTIYNSNMTFLISYFIIGFLYMFLSLCISKDRTLGLAIMSLRLLSDKWVRIDIKVIAIRSLSNGVFVLHFINILYMLLNKTTDSLFDKLANSVVIKEEDAFNLTQKNN